MGERSWRFEETPPRIFQSSGRIEPRMTACPATYETIARPHCVCASGKSMVNCQRLQAAAFPQHHGMSSRSFRLVRATAPRCQVETRARATLHLGPRLPKTVHTCERNKPYPPPSNRYDCRAASGSERRSKMQSALSHAWYTSSCSDRLSCLLPRISAYF